MMQHLLVGVSTIILVLACVIALVLVVNVVVVWIGARTFLDRAPTPKELTWLWSSWRNPLSVATWVGMGVYAIYIGHAGLVALRDNPWFIGLLALIVVNSVNAISHYYRSRLSPDRPAIFVSVEPDDGEGYTLLVTSTLAHHAHDVRAEVLEGDGGILSSPALSLLLDRGIGSVRPGETRYPLAFVCASDSMMPLIKLRMVWHDTPSVPDDKAGERPRPRSRVSCVDPYEVRSRYRPGSGRPSLITARSSDTASLGGGP